MMFNGKRNTYVSIIIPLILLLFPVALYATSASFDYGAGEINKGSGGVGAALPQDSLAGAINPAAAAFVAGDRLDTGITWVRPLSRGYSASGTGAILNGSYNSRTTLILPPSLGYLHHAKHSPLTYAVSVAGIGLTTDYSQSVFGAGSAGIYLQQIFTNFTAAWKVNPHWALGGSLVVATQSLGAKGLSAFSGQSNDPGNFSDRGTDWSFGAGVKTGTMLKLSPRVAIGAAYQPEIAMTKLKKYAGLLPDAGSFNIPPTAVAGLGLQLTPTVQAGFDTQYIWYSAVPAYSNSTVCNASGKCFGIAGGSGFGWKNTALFKFGLIWHAKPTWTLRGGYVHSTQPIQSTDMLLAILAPATSQNQFTAGLTHRFKKRFALSAFAMYSPKKSMSGQVVTPMVGTQTVTVHLEQFETGISFTWFIGGTNTATV